MTKRYRKTRGSIEEELRLLSKAMPIAVAGYAVASGSVKYNHCISASSLAVGYLKSIGFEAKPVCCSAIVCNGGMVGFIGRPSASEIQSDFAEMLMSNLRGVQCLDLTASDPERELASSHWIVSVGRYFADFTIGQMHFPANGVRVPPSIWFKSEDQSALKAVVVDGENTFMWISREESLAQEDEVSAAHATPRALDLNGLKWVIGLMRKHGARDGYRLALGANPILGSWLSRFAATGCGSQLPLTP